MRKIYKYLCTMMLATMFAANAAIADGLGVGIILNSSTFSTAGSENEGVGVSGGELEKTSISKDVEFPSLFIQYETPTLGAGFSLTAGVEIIPGSHTLGSKQRSDTASDANETNTDTKTYTGKAEVEDIWGLYFEPTYAVNENVGLYVKGGISTLNLVTLEDISSGTDSSVYPNERIFGASYGFGLSADLPSFGGMFVKAEYSFTGYEPVTFNSSSGNKNRIKADTEQEAYRIAIGYSF